MEKATMMIADETSKPPQVVWDQETISQQATYAQFYMNQKQETHMMKKRKGLRSISFGELYMREFAWC
jgi:hypothetical protein